MTFVSDDRFVSETINDYIEKQATYLKGFFVSALVIFKFHCQIIERFGYYKTTENCLTENECD